MIFLKNARGKHKKLAKIAAKGYNRVIHGTEEQKMPEILGVIVVASGAEEVKIKLKILTAVSTALGINGNSIQIYTRRDS